MQKNNTSIEKRKIGILTFTYGDNYGQRLQNLAVQEILKLYGYDVYTIPQVLPKNYVVKNHDRHNCFLEFDNENIKYYEYPIGRHRIPQGLQDFSFFVAGSDQIWSPYSNDVNSSLFLRFTSRGKRICLAPSMATSNIPWKKKLVYKLYFNGFDKISVREEESARIIQKYTSKKVETLIDPTLMFDAEFWQKYEKKPKYEVPKNYFLYYGLGNSIENYKVLDIASKHNCSVLFLKEGHKEFDIGPSEFLYLIRHASYVITDSYHGTIFSILYRKPFYHLVREQGGLDMSSRFDTLFSKLSINIDKMEQSEINYDMVFKKIEKERNKVRLYISQYLL